MAILSEEKTRQLLWTVTVNFDILDAKGRKIGVQYRVHKVELVPAKPGALGGYVVKPGVYWVASFHGTRNGEIYGPLTRNIWADSQDGIEKAILRRITDSKARALKKYGQKES